MKTRTTKGKTYEEIYGKDKAIKLRELRRQDAIKQMKVQRKGKTHVEIYGNEQAEKIAKIKSNIFSGKGNPRYKDGKNQFICKNCNEIFKTEKYHADCRKRKFCSDECYSEHISHKIEYNCVICNKIKSRKPSQVGVKVCSRKCFNIWKRGSNNSNWNGGSSFEPYSLEWTKELRNYIRKRDNYTCQLCDIVEQEHIKKYGRILTVHHMDYNKKNCNEENLITLCVKCNSQVNGTRDYWVAYFQCILENRGIV